MKTLILLRHAKAEADAVDDAHRQLTDRGREQAHSIGPRIAALEVPELVVYVSTAIRASATWREIAPALGHEVVTRELPAMYTFDEDEILQVLREVDEDDEAVMLIGHNPGLSYLATLLSGAELPADEQIAKYGALRTCRGVVLDYDGLWCDIDSQDCEVREYLAPETD